MLADAISHAIQGTEKFSEHIKKVIGSVLIQIGTELLAAGLAMHLLECLRLMLSLLH